MKTWAKHFRADSRGFTIIELLIVVVVIALLVAILFLGYGAVQNSAHDTSVKNDLQRIDDVFKQYALDNEGVYPNSSALLVPLGLKLNKDSYYSGDKSNVYVCTNPTSTEYAVVAKSKSGKRFYIKSEKGINEYTGAVVWDSTTGNWSAMCADIDATYISPSNLAGMTDATWMSWTGVIGAASTMITNLITNPSFEVSGTTNVVSLGGIVTFAQSSSWASNGTYSISLTPTVAISDSSIAIEGDAGAMRLGMVAGKTYTASGTIRLTAAQTGSLDPRARTIQLFYKTPFGYAGVGSAQAPNTAGVTRLSVTTTLPIEATEAFVRYYNGASPGGGVVYWDGLMLNEGYTLYNFGDGSTPLWNWLGSPGLSASSGPAP